MNAIPGWIWVVEIAALTALVAALAAAVHAGARAHVGDRAAARVAIGAGALLGGWLLASAILAGVGGYLPRPGETVPTIAFPLIGVLVGCLLAARIPVVSASLTGPDAVARLTAIQAFRAVGGLFLVVMALGQLPPVFALPAGIGDFAVGIAAPFVARAIARDPSRRRLAVTFHLLGMLDLVVAVAIGVMASPGRLHVLDTVPTTNQMTMLPLVLVPTMAVPVAVALHIVALQQLRRLQRGAEARGALHGSPGHHATLSVR